MKRCDVLVVGGGPAGSTCARSLRAAGLHVVILDKARFPRDKVCAGWITPPVLRALALEPDEYACGRTLQPFSGFITGTVGGKAIETRYDGPVSFGILRPEFDDFLLRRSGAELRLGEALRTLQRSDMGWLANGEIESAVVVGAGGHFCPTARLLGRSGLGETVVAQTAEVELTGEEARLCPIDPETPELYFSPDLQGYGWCLRKGRYLNVGMGRTGGQNLRRHLEGFLSFLRRRGRLPPNGPLPFRGHAYRLRPIRAESSAADGILWIGDAAGLADRKSGEGIGPAVDSGLRAAQRVLAARGDYSRQNLEPFELPRAAPQLDISIPAAKHLKAFVGRRLLATRWFARRIVLERWFLANSPASLNPKARLLS